MSISDPKESPLQHLCFQHPWHPYQKRVLDAIKSHLADERLHIVAAPGAGKTILGLETIRLLGKPSLILSPTRIIQNQWIQRLEEFNQGTMPDVSAWTSSSLDNPAYLSSITYQALHQRTRNTEEDPVSQLRSPDNLPTTSEIQDAAKKLKEAGIQTLVLDEAHHLRAAWWKVLNLLVKEMEDVTVVALTATPPYDVIGAEWKRYEELCGPIDEEISVPELVLSNTLCPHQDFVWVVEPTLEEREIVTDYDRHVFEITESLSVDLEFISAVKSHAWLQVDISHETILEAPRFLFSLLVFLKEIGETIPDHLLLLLDTSVENLPALTRDWWKVLLLNYLHSETGWEATEEVTQHKAVLKSTLRSLALYHRKQLLFDENREVVNHLVQSKSKINACVDIHLLEKETRGDQLRQAILTDYIGYKQQRLGVWSIFLGLISSPAVDRADIVLITGSQVVIYKTHADKIYAQIDAKRFPAKISQDHSLDGFLEIDASGSGSKFVPHITEFLAQGLITTIVGTRSLLGEGWDAPALNSLVMATYVGSHMLTNQIRGRAIRKSPHNPEKRSSIWHIAAVDLSTPTGRSDLANLERRFNTFVGLANDGSTIVSGFKRMQIPYLLIQEDFAHVNQLAKERLQLIGQISNTWKKALLVEGSTGVVPSVEIQSKKPVSVRPYAFFNTGKYLAFTALSSFMFFVTKTVELFYNIGKLDEFNWLFWVAGAGGLTYASPHLFRALRTAIRHAPVGGTLNQIALVVRDALTEANIIQTPTALTRVECTELYRGEWSIALLGGTFYEKSLFSDALAEVLEPIKNPRYLITRLGRNIWSKHVDFHAVPAVLSTKKERAMIFAAHWKERIGPSQLIFTRSMEGRKKLLASRLHSLSSEFENPVLRKDRWR